jgi:hypothetical protein
MADGGGEVVRVLPPRPVQQVPAEPPPQPQQRGFNLFRGW